MSDEDFIHGTGWGPDMGSPTKPIPAEREWRVIVSRRSLQPWSEGELEDHHFRVWAVDYPHALQEALSRLSRHDRLVEVKPWAS
jgi:hypothetical protein